MIRSLAAGAGLGLALVLAPAARTAEVPAIPVLAGDKVYADLDGPADRDEFSLQVAEGALLTCSVAASGKSPLLPSFDLIRPDGTKINLQPHIVGEGSKVASLPGLVFTETGTFTFSIRGFASTSGAYVASFAVSAPTSIKETIVVPAGETLLRSFTGWTDAAVTYTVTEKGGPPLVGAYIEGPGEEVIPASTGVRKGTKIGAKGVLLTGGPGLYELAIEGDPAGDTTVEVSSKIKFPKASKRKLRLGPEPRPTTFTPATGLGGATITVQGAGFVDGSRIVFDGQADATDVVLGEDGSLTGKCPVYSGSSVGAQVPLAIVNPDGQVGQLTGLFRFIGIPALTFADPNLSPLEGGITVTLHGVRFRAGATVRFDGILASNVVLQAGDRIACVNPPHATGTVNVTVTDEYGRPSGTIPFDYIGPPAVATVTPTTIPSYGGQTMTVTGTEFLAGDRVFLGGVEATNVVVASRTSLTFRAPAGSAGIAALEVRDVLDRSGTLPNAVTITESFVDVTATALPAATPGSDFPGQWIAVGELSGDGLPDILVSSAIPHVNSITKQADVGTFLLQNAAGALFSDATSKLSTQTANGDRGQTDALSIGDLDNNGIADILLSRAAPNTISPATFPFQGYTGVYLAADGVAYDSPTRIASRILRATAVNGTFGDSTSTHLATSASTPAFGFGERWQSGASGIGDMDGDGDLDVLFVGAGRVDSGVVSKTTWSYTRVPGYYPGYYYYYKDKAKLTQTATQLGSARVLRNNGLGRAITVATRQAPVASSGGILLDQFSANACAVGDLDGDGFADAVLLSKVPTKKEVGANVVNASALRVLFSSNVARLTFDATALPAVYDDANAGSGDFWQGSNVFLGDLDGDNRLDIVVGRDQATYWTDSTNAKRLLPAVRIFRNLGSRKFAEETGTFLADGLFRTGSATTLLGARGVAFRDVDRDGKKDLVVTSRQATVLDRGDGLGPNGILPAGSRSATRILIKNASGKFVDDTDARLPPASLGPLFQADCIGMADFNVDGKMDIVLGMDIAPADGTRPVKVLLAK